MKINIKASHGVQALGNSDAKGQEWDVVLIESGLSKNGVLYPDDVLRTSIPLFEGSKACCYRFGDHFDHLDDSTERRRPKGFHENDVGVFKNVKFQEFTRPDGSTGKGLVARLHIFDGHEGLMRKLKDAWGHGCHDFLGLSINADGKGRHGFQFGQKVQLVEKTRVYHLQSS